jgi:hypothetical protein
MFGSAMLVTAFPLWVADMTEDIAERLILLITQNRPDGKIPSTPGSSIEKSGQAFGSCHDREEVKGRFLQAIEPFRIWLAVCVVLGL